MFFHAGRADAMAEKSVRVFTYKFFKLVPMSFTIMNFFTVTANRNFSA
jgi:hypothetical protein